MSTAVPSSIRAVRLRLDPRVAAMAAVVVGLHVAGIGLLLACSSRHDAAGGSAIGISTGALAYSLGLRHAFDVDHIAAIDNSTRAMLRRGRTPYSTGFFFALGHSSVVFAMTVLLCTSVRVFAGPLRDPGSTLHRWTGLIGAGVSGSFLLLIGAVNVGVLVNVARVFRDLRHGRYDEDGFEQLLTARGLFSRLLGGALRRVDRPWKLYPLGLLFGLGFDTATEIGLLVLALTAGAASLPMWAMLSLPLLFAAGMVLLDTVDGVLMCRAYAWAFVRPVRKVYYNLTMTALSVFLALFIGLQIVLQLLGRTLGLEGGVWRLANSVDLQTAGYVVVLVFLGVWGLAAGIWRFGRIEQRWAAPVDGADHDAS
ncbi:MAG TPA: HoxN/HupN/NixA family nickel/cobalt transporter [Nocardioides sp.]|nr:HoxN/HupN/NixA family nickel/cobalt transporter [Nocardioides sp.]